MQGRIITTTTPQQKIVGVNNKFGNTNIAQQQGTTRVLFDTLPLDGRTEFRFFENSNSRQYPFTNVGAEGNRLNVGETFVVQKIYFGIASINEDGSLGGFDTLKGLGFIPFEYGEISFFVANNQVIKQLPFHTCITPINITAINSNDEAFSTFTDIVIPPLLEYVLTYRSNNYLARAGESLTCFIEGTAGILAPQTTF